jgi:hypothetical protein
MLLTKIAVPEEQKGAELLFFCNRAWSLRSDRGVLAGYSYWAFLMVTSNNNKINNLPSKGGGLHTQHQQHRGAIDCFSSATSAEEKVCACPVNRLRFNIPNDLNEPTITTI